MDLVTTGLVAQGCGENKLAKCFLGAVEVEPGGWAVGERECPLGLRGDTGNSRELSLF